MGKNTDKGLGDAAKSGPRSTALTGASAQAPAAGQSPSIAIAGLAISKANRYKCVHCGKVGYSAGHMRKHAERCTLNPERKCGMHALMQGGKGAIEVRDKTIAAIAWLPKEVAFRIPMTDAWGKEMKMENGAWSWSGLTEAIALALPAVREAVDNCPACVLAALRQSGIPMYQVSSFDFKAECATVLAGVNETYDHDNY